MKTEAQIRKHRDNLRAVVDLPCDCAARGHATQCILGGLKMAANIQLLTWLLGEDAGFDRVDEELAAAAARSRTGG